MRTSKTKTSLTFLAILLTLPSLAIGAPSTVKEASNALEKGISFFHKEVAVRGSYVYRYSADLKKREGEGKVGLTTGWTQPPGTPSVGEAFVIAYEQTGADYALKAAKATADALVATQLHSGGWDSRIEMSGSDRKRFAYRTDGKLSRKARNNTSLDDDKTQSCIRFLLQYDRATGFSDLKVHAVTQSALESLLSAQFPNGAWPHVYRNPSDSKPIIAANYATDGQYQRIKNYWDFYTLNDNLMPDVIKTLFLAEKVYDIPTASPALRALGVRARHAAERAGNFLVLAQMPKPQPAWAQQYDFEMRPTWARKFEPPAITGGESQSVMMTLLDLYEQTGKRKYLAPIPPALAYFQKSLLSDGKLARFYELGSNKPLYFTRDYQLTHDDGDVPTHYSFKTSSKLNSIKARYESLSSTHGPAREHTARAPLPSHDAIQRIINSQDDRGAWVEEGRMRYWGKDDSTTQVIQSATFARNIRTLAHYIHHHRTSPAN